MTNQSAALEPAAAEPEGANGWHVEDPGPWRNFWVSVSAVVTKELRWRMRGRRAFLILTGYVALLALLVYFAYGLMYDRAQFDAAFDGRAGFVAGTASARIGQAIWTTILVVQMTLTMMLAPALSSGSISMEREKQTLELLITSPVSTLGMVTGKLLSSLAYVLLLILASIPLMTIVFAFGGIAPEDVVRAYLLLFAVAIGLGSIGAFLSALIKRTHVATALSYLILFALVIGAFILHTVWWAGSQREDDFELRRAPEGLLWLNPVIAVVDLGCTAIPESYSVTCAYISTVVGEPFDPGSPTRDAFWPRTALAFLVLAAGLTLASTQLISPSRRWRREGRPPDGELPALVSGASATAADGGAFRPESTRAETDADG